MVCPRAVLDQHADGGVWHRRPARRRGDHDSRPLPVALPKLPAVTLYHAQGCHLCDRAIEVVREARDRAAFDLELVDIGGDDALEAAYRAFLPVIEIDGVRAFTHFVSVDALLASLKPPGDGCPDHGEERAGNM